MPVYVVAWPEVDDQVEWFWIVGFSCDWLWRKQWEDGEQWILYVPENITGKNSPRTR